MEFTIVVRAKCVFVARLDGELCVELCSGVVVFGAIEGVSRCISYIDGSLRRVFATWFHDVGQLEERVVRISTYLYVCGSV